VLDQGYANQSQDFTPVVLAVKQSGADVLGTYFTFENDLGIFARQLRQLGVNIPWVGSPSVVAVIIDQARGRGAVRHLWRCGLRGGFQRVFEAYGKAYRDAYKTAPDNQSAWPYDSDHDPVGGDQQGRFNRPCQISARRSWPPRKRPARKANTISTRTATACTATTS